MKHLSAVCQLLVLSFVVSAVARTAGAAARPGSQSQTAPEPPPTIAAVIDFQIGELEHQLLRVVEAMPEDKFDYAPTQLNTKDSRDPMRSFAFEVKHIATVNYTVWSPLTGDAMPANIKGSNGPDNLKTKSEILKYLKDSFALGHKAAAALTPQNMVEEVSFRQGKAPRLYLTTFAVGHGYDHYGQLVLFLRMNGITPPGSRAPH